MKVQFEAGRLRLRVTRAELQALRAGNVLSTRLDWPGGGWRVDAIAAAAGGIEAAAGTLRILLAQSQLATLESTLPSREGLRQTFPLPAGPIELRFEVDLHDGRRPR